MPALTKGPAREIIEDFAKEICRRKAPTAKPSTEVINFRTDVRDAKERPVYQVPIDLLRYRKDNGRIASDVQDYENNTGILDEKDDEAQAQIAKFLEQKDPEKTEVLKHTILHAGQTYPAIITCDGFLINGNRRKMVMDGLRRDHPGDPRFTYMKVVILPGTDEPGGPPTLFEIEKIENRYQLQSDGKSEYYGFDRALSIKRKIEIGLSLEEQLRDDPHYVSLNKTEFEKVVREYEKDYLYSEGYLRPFNLTSVDCTNETQIGAHVLDMLIEGDSTYRGEVLGYLKPFEMKEGEIQYCPPPEARGKHSAVRNFLMELRVVTYDRARDIYRLAPEHFSLYVASVVSEPALSLRSFRQMIRDKEDIGLAAELAVLAYERERVGTRYSECVEHTALKNVSAGYDITSVTADECSLLPRLIEVKAVSAQDLQFFWSANEVAIAGKFAPWYYLYLLPVERHGEFSMDGLKIIPDPCAVILAQGGEWLTEENAVRCAIEEEGTRSQQEERYDVR